MRIKPATRHPADPRAVFVLTLAVWAAIPLVLGIAEPGDLEDQLPLWAVILWGLGLGVGATATLIGMAFQSLNGVIVEQAGNATVAAASLFYAAVAVIATEGLPMDGAVVLGWGLSCLWRWLQLQSLVNFSHQEAEKS